MKNIKRNWFFMAAILLASGICSIQIQASEKIPFTFCEEAVGGAYLTFAGKFGGEVSIKDLRANEKVEVAGCAAGSKIYRFELKVTQNGKTKSYQTKNSNLTKEMLTHLQSLSKGDEFEFKSIKATLPKGGEVDVHSRTFFVV